MSDKKTGGPAFPITETDHLSIEKGMTLRDYFAAKAMQAMLGNPTLRPEIKMSDVCSTAYQIADLMLKERDQ